MCLTFLTTREQLFYALLGFILEFALRTNDIFLKKVSPKVGTISCRFLMYVLLKTVPLLGK